jgi:hypothetical protein
LLGLLDKQGQLALKMDDEIIANTLLTKDGEVLSARVKDALAAQKTA